MLLLTQSVRTDCDYLTARSSLVSYLVSLSVALPPLVRKLPTFRVDNKCMTAFTAALY